MPAGITKNDKHAAFLLDSFLASAATHSLLFDMIDASFTHLFLKKIGHSSS
jgi:hypothetical protein